MFRVPLSWLSDWVALPEGVSAAQVASDLVRVGLEEEAIHGSQISGPLTVGKVLTKEGEPQKNGKTINWCTVDVGESEPRGIVCGAHNFEPGDLVVVALPGTVLPGPFEITARKTYGHISDGMICSVRELGIGDDHSGILVLSGDYANASVGDSALELLGLGGSVVEINVTPDRGYCFSIRGVAREYSLSTGAPFTDLVQGIVPPKPSTKGPQVVIDDNAPIRGKMGCDRFAARVVRGVAAGQPSPQWMQRRIQDAGMRPISLAVDVTNYVMLEFGQPMHAYDVADVVEPIVVRRARAGEEMVTLDDVRRVLSDDDLLITDSQGGQGMRPLGLAGVMGGAGTAIAADTTDLLLEAAHFDPTTVARSSRRHRLSSDASRRFERGVDPDLCAKAIQRAVDLLLEYGGGQASDDLTDVDYHGKAEPIAFDLQAPSALIGVDYSPQQVTSILESIGCTVKKTLVTAPSWRPDLNTSVDLIEEVARLDGYDKIPSVLPTAPPGRGETFPQRARRKIASLMVDRGMTEVISSSFTSVEAFDALHLAADDLRRRAVRLLNPLSEEEPYMRTNLIASLGDVLRRNVGRGTQDLHLFEIGSVAQASLDALIAPNVAPGIYPPQDVLDQIRRAVPDQHLALGVMMSGKIEPASWYGPGRQVDYTDAVDVAVLVAQSVGVTVDVIAAEAMPWHPGRCAGVRVNEEIIGYAGELHPAVIRDCELPPGTVALEINLDRLIDVADELFTFDGLSTYPAAKEDIALVISNDIPAGVLLDEIRKLGGEEIEDASIFDVYEGSQVPQGHRSIAISLKMRSKTKTLDAADLERIRSTILKGVEKRFGAVIRT